jgi:hypothetical protein
MVSAQKGERWTREEATNVLDDLLALVDNDLLTRSVDDGVTGGVQSSELSLVLSGGNVRLPDLCDGDDVLAVNLRSVLGVEDGLDVVLDVVNVAVDLALALDLFDLVVVTSLVCVGEKGERNKRSKRQKREKGGKEKDQRNRNGRKRRTRTGRTGNGSEVLVVMSGELGVGLGKNRVALGLVVGVVGRVSVLLEVSGRTLDAVRVRVSTGGTGRSGGDTLARSGGGGRVARGGGRRRTVEDGGASGGGGVRGGADVVTSEAGALGVTSTVGVVVVGVGRRMGVIGGEVAGGRLVVVGRENLNREKRVRKRRDDDDDDDGRVRRWREKRRTHLLDLVHVDLGRLFGLL